MRDFRNIIQSEARKIDRLHKQIHVTYEARSKDLGAWKEACAAFHSHVSAIDPLIERIYEAFELNDELVEFSVTFLELDPMFLRSGYIKEEMLRKLKRSALLEKRKERLRAVLIDAVNSRGTREFRRYCRLLPKVSSPRLIAALETANQFGEGSRKHRAAVMLGYADGSST
jgi:hypothetical protein